MIRTAFYFTSNTMSQKYLWIRAALLKHSAVSKTKHISRVQNVV